MAELIASGLSRQAIARELGVAKSTVSYHARRLGEPGSPQFGRRYDWAEIGRFYDAGHSVRECQERFGFSKQAWNNAVRRGDVVARPRLTPLAHLLAVDAPRSRWNIKRRLLKEGLKQARCEQCGLERWRGEPLQLALHHVNGDPEDNRLENLALLCPNCHSQTENFGVKNVAREALVG
ncbi:MAG TPA: LuxR C-terminal-related transcriptional regulator [Thermoleophilaceae bacterium]